MNTRRKWALFFLNFGIAAVLIVLFSDAFLGLKLLNASALSLSFAWTAVIVSVLVFFMGNRAILLADKPVMPAKKEPTLEDSVADLTKAMDHGDIFDAAIQKNIEQVRRFERKRDITRKQLLQKFSSGELSYQKFAGVLSDVENVLQLNIRSILNKISAFDVAEYEDKRPGKFRDEALEQEKRTIYNEYIEYVDTATKTNEDILLKLDKILLELSRFDSLEHTDVYSLPAMIEMDELIQNANRYR